MGRSKQLRARNEIKELREENRQLRELVAHLSQPALNRITEAAKPGEQVAGAGRICDRFVTLVRIAPPVVAPKQSELSMYQSAGIDMIVNLRSAKYLGIGVPHGIIGRANALMARCRPLGTGRSLYYNVYYGTRLYFLHGQAFAMASLASSRKSSFLRSGRASI